MNFTKKQQQIPKLNPANDKSTSPDKLFQDNITGNINNSINAISKTLSETTFAPAPLKNLNITSLNMENNNPNKNQIKRPTLNYNSSAPQFLSNSNNSSGGISSNAETNQYFSNTLLNNPHSRPGNNRDGIVLPYIGSLNQPSFSSDMNKNSSGSLLNSNDTGPFSFAKGGFTSHDYRATLNDAKKFLESENSNKINTNPTLFGTANARPPVLTPISTDNSYSNNSSPRTRRPFDLKNILNSDPNPPSVPRPTHLLNLNNGKGMKFPNSQTSSNTNTATSLDVPSLGLSLNLPTSSRSSSVSSSPSLSSSSSSLAQFQNISSRLEAVNSDKFREIMTNTGYLLIDNKRIKTSMDDLTPICELGSGTCGHVIKMKHNLSNYIMAVKQMSISGIAEENKRIIMDLDVVLKSHDCFDIVKCLGYFISQSDVWICMELMSMCFDKLLKLYKRPIPEEILGKLTVSTLNALSYLKEQHNVIHRDIKPSNILIDENGAIKLCDFGISGNLINSNAQSRNNAGCAGYMAPERIDPLDPTNPVYDIRADVWSLGVTLVELATGEYPYKHCHTEFEVMTTILQCDAPKLEGDQYSDKFKSFVNQCLTKDVKKRPKYTILQQHPFVLHYKEAKVDVKSWFKNLTNQNQDSSPDSNDLIDSKLADLFSSASKASNEFKSS